MVDPPPTPPSIPPAIPAEAGTYRCPACWMHSHNPHDAANLYCGYCHRFEADGPPHPARDVNADAPAGQRGWWRWQSMPPIALTAMTWHLLLSAQLQHDGNGYSIGVWRRALTPLQGPHLLALRPLWRGWRRHWDEVTATATDLMDHGPTAAPGHRSLTHD